MRASDILLKAFSDMPEQLDPRLVRVLLDAAEALLDCHRLTLTDLGRSLPRDCGRKHAVKCIDRLLKNARVEASRPEIGAALATDLFGETKTPLLLVDWTETGPGYWALSVATPIGGRAIALYHEVHPTSLQANPEVEKAFLRTLKESVVPRNCKPIVVTDSGFGTPWFEAVCDVGWDGTMWAAWVGECSSAGTQMTLTKLRRGRPSRQSMKGPAASRRISELTF